MKSPNLRLLGVEEEEKIQTKGIDNLFNRIIAENFPSLESYPCAGSLQNTNHQDQKETPPDTS
jgi:hypothetical protein